MRRKIGLGIVCVGALALVGGCTTVKNRIPDFDFIKLPEFREEAENIGDYPDVTTVPHAPTDVRSDAQWDQAARAQMVIGDGFTAPSDGAPAKSEAEIEREIEELSRRVEAYKQDDPQ